ncbi:MAG: single-stranded DNA-binding protein [Cyanobacteria bacterium SZAS-4]|nr:single-stranded DNA-binding protein [Cyanobacteria bacterium SZAS-4]
MINHVNVVGHVGRKPKVTVFPSGKKLAKFSIAVNQLARNGAKQAPLWLDIEAWESMADRIIKCELDSGKMIAIDGSLAPNVYSVEVGGQSKEIQKVKVKLLSFELMTKKESGGAAPPYESEETAMTVHEDSPESKKSN